MYTFTNAGAVEDSSVTVRARLENADGELYVAADIASIVYSVFDLTLGTVVSGHNAAAISPVSGVFVTPATSADNPAVWNGKHSYNFKHTISGTAFPLGGRQYQIEYTLTPASGEAIKTMPIIINVTERRAG